MYIILGLRTSRTQTKSLYFMKNLGRTKALSRDFVESYVLHPLAFFLFMLFFSFRQFRAAFWKNKSTKIIFFKKKFELVSGLQLSCFDSAQIQAKERNRSSSDAIGSHITRLFGNLIFSNFLIFAVIIFLASITYCSKVWYKLFCLVIIC